MATDISEKGLESIIATYLCDKQGYEQGVQMTITRSTVLIPNV